MIKLLNQLWCYLAYDHNYVVKYHQDDTDEDTTVVCWRCKAETKINLK